MTIPEGYEPIFRSSPFLDHIGKFYSKGLGKELSLAVQVPETALNGRGLAHAGFVAALVDVALGYATATASTPPRPLVTTTLSMDFAGAIKARAWLTTRTEVYKQGKRLSFANVYVLDEGRPVVRANASFYDPTSG